MDIFEAAEVGDYDAVCSLLQLKAKPEEHQNEVGFTALLAAALICCAKFGLLLILTPCYRAILHTS